MRIKLWSQAQDAEFPPSLNPQCATRNPECQFYTLVQGTVGLMLLICMLLFENSSTLFVSWHRALGWSLLPTEMASAKSILLYQPCHQPQKHKTGKLDKSRNYTISKKTPKKPLKKITTLESTSRDNANAKSLAQFKGGLDIYTDNGNNGSEKMILKAI